jgi:hypothetical protein
MLRMKWRPAIALLTMATTSSASAQADFAPGEGIFCAAAIYQAAAQAAKRCFPVEAVELRAELDRSIERLNAYILSNSDWTPERLAQFSDEQIKIEPDARPCEDAAAQLFRKMMTAKPETLRAAVDLGTARPGNPTWGTSPRGESIDAKLVSPSLPTWRDCL